jgi:hypothetical protein
MANVVTVPVTVVATEETAQESPPSVVTQSLLSCVST